ncbi:MAG: clan AA aspartic protease [Candidatus Aminicenantes bacterium]|nr:clan AA aspartic protease [Candidatus Aminicenantes bacterium]
MIRVINIILTVMILLSSTLSSGQANSFHFSRWNSNCPGGKSRINEVLDGVFKPLKKNKKLNGSAIIEESSGIIIPMDLSLNRPVIEIYITRKGPYRFIFDTGASGNIIDKDLASLFDLKETGKVEVGTPGSEKTSSAPVLNIPEITVSEQTLSDISMVVMDLRKMIPVDGILSFREFSEFLININYPEKRIVLEKGELNKDQANVTALVPDQIILTVPLKVDERMWNAHLDTGSPVFFAFPYALKDQLKFKSPPVLLSGQARTVAGAHRNWAAELDGSIKLADIIYNSPEIILSERNNDYVNIGYQLLKDFIITIDQRNQLIQFSKSKAENTNAGKVQENDHKGITGRYGGIRSITLENGIYYIQRDGSLKLKLVEIDDSLYEGQLPRGFKAMNELPKIRFERDDGDRVIGLSFIYPDGKEEFVKKDDMSE